MSFKAKLAVFILAVSLTVLVFNLIACSSCCLDLFRLRDKGDTAVSTFVTSMRTDGHVFN